MLIQLARDHPLNSKAMTHGVSKGSLMVFLLQRSPLFHYDIKVALSL